MSDHESWVHTYRGVLRGVDDTHYVLVDVPEDKPIHVLLTIVSAVDGAPLAHIKLEPYIAIHVSHKLREAAVAAQGCIDIVRRAREAPTWEVAPDAGDAIAQDEEPTQEPNMSDDYVRSDNELSGNIERAREVISVILSNVRTEEDWSGTHHRPTKKQAAALETARAQLADCQRSRDAWLSSVRG